MNKVTEILTNHFGWQRKESIDKADEEIHEHYMKFMEWFLWQDDIGTEGTAMGDNGVLKVFDDDNTERTLKEVYQYYCDNVLNKAK